MDRRQFLMAAAATGLVAGRASAASPAPNAKRLWLLVDKRAPLAGETATAAQRAGARVSLVPHDISMLMSGLEAWLARPSHRIVGLTRNSTFALLQSFLVPHRGRIAFKMTCTGGGLDGAVNDQTGDALVRLGSDLDIRHRTRLSGLAVATAGPRRGGHLFWAIAASHAGTAQRGFVS